MQKFPRRLHHKTPAWIPDTAIYHIRCGVLPGSDRTLVDHAVAPQLLESFRFYGQTQRWSCYLAVIMPDHIHALLSFGRGKSMSRTIGAWKSFLCRKHGIRWRSNYFDHRIRSHGEFTRSFYYLLDNPVRAGLCSSKEDWPWKAIAMAPDAVPKF